MKPSTKPGPQRRPHGEPEPYLRPDGRWAVGIELPPSGDGRRHRRTLYGPSPSAVLRKLRKAQGDLRAGSAPPDFRQTVASVLDRWLTARRPKEHRVGSIVASTWIGYEAHVRRHIAPYLGSLKMTRLTEERVEAWLDEREDAGMSAAMRRKVLVTLRAALKWAVTKGHARGNVAALVDLPRTMSRPPWTPPSEDYAQNVIDASAGHRLGPMFILALVTGARSGELRALVWDDIDLERGTLAINHTLSFANGAPELLDTKTDGSRRILLLPPVILELLKSHRATQALERARSTWVEYGFVFTRANGRPLRGDGTGGSSDQFKRCLRRAGVEPMRFHDLRHLAASVILDVTDGNIFVTQKTIGHLASQTTTGTYGHLTPQVRRELARQLNDLYAPMLKGNGMCGSSPQGGGHAAP